MNFFSDCPHDLAEILDQLISKHKSLFEGLFGYTSARSIIRPTTIFSALGLSGLEIGSFNFVYTQTWTVCCRLYVEGSEL